MSLVEGQWHENQYLDISDDQIFKNKPVDKPNFTLVLAHWLIKLVIFTIVKSNFWFRMQMPMTQSSRSKMISFVFKTFRHRISRIFDRVKHFLHTICVKNIYKIMHLYKCLIKRIHYILDWALDDHLARSWVGCPQNLWAGNASSRQ